MEGVDDLLAADRAHVWHPYAAMPAAVPPLPVESAQGVRLRLADGRELVDGMSSWWAAIHGYRHPVLDAAVRDQLGAMSHVMFGGLTHGPAVELARLLVDVTPAGLEHVFFCRLRLGVGRGRDQDVPAVLALARPPGQAPADDLARRLPRRHLRRDERLRPGRRHARAVARRAAAAGVRRRAAASRSSRDYVAELARLVETHADELAAVIVEPVVQGAGGMRFHDPRYLHVLRELCLTHDVLLVFDEIATGFGRTGELFAAEHAGSRRTCMCVGKALTGGYLSMAATLCTAAVARGDLRRARRACSCTGRRSWATRSLRRSRSRRSGCCWSAAGAPRSRAIEAGAAGRARARARRCPGCADVRVLGAIGVVQLDHPVDVPRRRPRRPRPGVWLRPFRDLVYTMPPYVCGPDDLAAITAAVRAAASRRVAPPATGCRASPGDPARRRGRSCRWAGLSCPCVWPVSDVV